MREFEKKVKTCFLPLCKVGVIVGFLFYKYTAPPVSAVRKREATEAVKILLSWFIYVLQSNIPSSWASHHLMS